MNKYIKFPPGGRPATADPARLDRLRRQIRKLERHMAKPAKAVRTLPFGIAEIDQTLPWGGLPLSGLHEVIAAAPGAGIGFLAALLGRAAGAAAPVLWCRRERGLYGPGLAPLGLGPDRLVVIRANRANDLLWAMEEGLRSGAPSAVVGEIGEVPPVALRRLQLAAESGATAAVLLRPDRLRAPSSPAVTRWRVTPAPSHPRSVAALAPVSWPGPPRWRLELLRCRSGALGWAGETAKASGTWFVEWCDERNDGKTERRGGRPTARGFALAAGLRHRPAAPPATLGRTGASAIRHAL